MCKIERNLIVILPTLLSSNGFKILAHLTLKCVCVGVCSLHISIHACSMLLAISSTCSGLRRAVSSC